MNKGLHVMGGGMLYMPAGRVLCSIAPQVRRYNWLVSEMECCQRCEDSRIRVYKPGEYLWLSGDELLDMLAPYRDAQLGHAR